jgi:hypothetical protein
MAQFFTPGYTDTLITAVAFLITSVIFIENGAFSIRAGSSKKFALKVLMWMGWTSEVIPGWMPMILVSVLIRIYLSRAADKIIGESGVNVINKMRRGKAIKDIVNAKKYIKKRGGKMLKVASNRYGKGRRGARTLIKQSSVK